jgi:hypothetical protein
MIDVRIMWKVTRSLTIVWLLVTGVNVLRAQSPFYHSLKSVADRYVAPTLPESLWRFAKHRVNFGFILPATLGIDHEGNVTRITFGRLSGLGNEDVPDSVMADCERTIVAASRQWNFQRACIGTPYADEGGCHMLALFVFNLSKLSPFYDFVVSGQVQASEQ